MKKLIIKFYCMLFFSLPLNAMDTIDNYSNSKIKNVMNDTLDIICNENINKGIEYLKDNMTNQESSIPLDIFNDFLLLVNELKIQKNLIIHPNSCEDKQSYDLTNIIKLPSEIIHSILDFSRLDEDQYITTLLCLKHINKRKNIRKAFNESYIFLNFLSNFNTEKFHLINLNDPKEFYFKIKERVLSLNKTYIFQKLDIRIQLNNSKKPQSDVYFYFIEKFIYDHVEYLKLTKNKDKADTWIHNIENQQTLRGNRRYYPVNILLFPFYLD